MTNIPASLPWYESEEDFNTFLGLVPFDESKVADSYAQWVKKIEEIEQDGKNKGYTAYRITIKPAAIKEWCDRNDVLICRASIARYATEELAKKLAKE